MQIFITTIFILAQMAGSAPAESTSELIGQIGEIVVTAPRYEYEDEAWSGLMETVVVTGQRYDGEDTNIAGMTNRSTNQSFGRQSNFTSFVQGRVHIYLMILGTILLIIVRFLLPTFLFKSQKPADEVCYCENDH